RWPAAPARLRGPAASAQSRTSGPAAANPTPARTPARPPATTAPVRQKGPPAAACPGPPPAHPRFEAARGQCPRGFGHATRAPFILDRLQILLDSSRASSESGARPRGGRRPLPDAVGLAGVREGDVIADLAPLVQVQQGAIEGLHLVLAAHLH